MRRLRPRPVARALPAARALLAGTLLIGAIGSCELPKPQLPSIGAAPPPAAAVGVTARPTP